MGLSYSSFTRSGLDDTLWNPDVEKYGTETWTWEYNTIGIQFDSRATAVFNAEIAGIYKFQAKILMRPIYLVPFELWLAHVRPDNLIFGDEG